MHLVKVISTYLVSIRTAHPWVETNSCPTISAAIWFHSLASPCKVAALQIGSQIRLWQIVRYAMLDSTSLGESIIADSVEMFVVILAVMLKSTFRAIRMWKFVFVHIATLRIQNLRKRWAPAKIGGFWRWRMQKRIW